MISGAPNLVPPVGQTCNTGGTDGRVDPPPPVLLCYSEGVSRKSAPGDFFCEKADPRHPSIGHRNRARMVGKDTLYCTGIYCAFKYILKTGCISS